MIVSALFFGIGLGMVSWGLWLTTRSYLCLGLFWLLISISIATAMEEGDKNE